VTRNIAWGAQSWLEACLRQECLGPRHPDLLSFMPLLHRLLVVCLNAHLLLVMHCIDITCTSMFAQCMLSPLLCSGVYMAILRSA
jgi:hypothetical protein